METPEETEDSCPSSTVIESQKTLKAQKIDYRQKNLDHIQKLKEKKQKEQEEKDKQLKKEQDRKERLKKKILLQAQKVRQQKEKENSKAKEDIELPVIDQKPKRVVCQSLPKQCPEGSNKNFKKRHSDFLNSLSQGIKTKRQLEEIEKRKKQEQYEKLKEQMGFNKISSKLTKILQEQQQKRQVRSVSLEGTKQPQSPCLESVHAATTKGFQDKYSQYIQNIKKKKMEKQMQQQQKEKRMEKRKEKLKDYVLTTVKKNVLDGVYEDQEDDKKKGTKKKNQVGENQQIEEQDEEESAGEDEGQNKPKKKRRKMRNFPHVTDIVQWRKKNRLEPDTKVFIVTGGYGGIKKALYARGWVQNPDSTSSIFNMKWVLQSRQCDYNNLEQDHIVNHFQKNGAITTKVGLSKHLRGMKWVSNVDSDEFFPKCYDMCDQDDLLAFQQEFKICKAVTILKLYMKLASLKNMNELQKMQQKAKVAYDVLERNIITLDELIDKKKITQLVSKKEWDIMADDQLNTQGLAKKKHQEWLMSINLKFNDTKEKKKKKQKKKKAKESKEEKEGQQKQEDEEEKYDEFTQQIFDLLSKYETKYPQYNLTNTHNIWILKPAGLSRGRGITCFNSLVQILDHIKSKESQWIAQKYIQNPLIVQKRKFDIRLWVLVTSFNPLIIWKFDECYIRFSALDYNIDDVGNKFIHLTNNSIACMHKSFDKSEIKGNMYSQEEFSNYLKEKEGLDVFEQKIKSQMTNIIKWSMMAGQEHIEHRKNSHELYGYDFMIDEDYKVWLIQINSSPSMDFSTHITTRLVKMCLDDIVKVVVDYNDAPKKERKKVDTGAFKLIHKGMEIPDKHITTGLNLGIEGVQLKKGKKTTKLL